MTPGINTAARGEGAEGNSEAPRPSPSRPFPLPRMTLQPARVPVYLMGGAMGRLTLMVPLSESLSAT